MADENELRVEYSVVIVGRMNPAIHHPYWYKTHQLISDEELQESLSNGQLQAVSNPAMSILQFATTSFRVLCQPDKWEIHAKNGDNLARILSLTKSVFDGLLPQTPTTAMGLNVNATQGVGGASLVVAGAVRDCEIEFGIDDPVSANIQIVHSVGEIRETVQITTNPNNEQVTVATNLHRATTDQQGVFELSSILDRLCQLVEPAISRAKNILSQLGEQHAS